MSAPSRAQGERGDAAEALLARHGRSFHLASRLLPPGARHEAAVLYGFCRQVDDLADETPDPAEAARSLDAVLAELDGAPPRPWVAAFLDLARDRPGMVPPARCLVQAVRGDLEPVRVADDAELLRYCYGVAGTVGLLMCEVLGVRAPWARAHAIDLGVAMQLTNICRDVAEDAARGRVYLPAARLLAVGTTPERLLAGTARGPQVAQVVGDLLALAERYYESAELGLRAIPWRARGAILVAARLYRAIGRRLLRHHGSDPLHGRTVVPRWHRLLVALGGVGALLHPRTWAGARPRHDAALHLALVDLPHVGGRGT